MTIEWIAPKPSAAEVTGVTRIYSIFDGEGHISLGSNQYTVAKDDVPEVCEVMMKFAGRNSRHISVADVCKRIVDLLEAKRSIPDGVDDWDRSYRIAMDEAMRIVRKECGL